MPFLVLRVIQSMLFGASPIDLPIFAGVSMLLGTIALVAVWIPARRATQVDRWKRSAPSDTRRDSELT